MRFFERILGAFTQPPINVEAAVQIPLYNHNSARPLPSSAYDRQSETARNANETECMGINVGEDVNPIYGS